MVQVSYTGQDNIERLMKMPDILLGLYDSLYSLYTRALCDGKAQAAVDRKKTSFSTLLQIVRSIPRDLLYRVWCGFSNGSKGIECDTRYIVYEDYKYN